MQNKTLEFVKNGAISTIPFLAGGFAGAELSDLLTDNDTMITVTSTASQYLAGYGTFMCLHAYDNKDIYRNENKWNYKQLAIDTGKTFLSLGVAEVAYIAGRSGLMDYFLSKNYSSGESSLLADLITIPLFFGIAIPLAKKTGLIKEYDKLK